MNSSVRSSGRTAATSAGTRPDAAGASAVTRWATLAVVSGGLFLAVLSTTVVSVALPSIGSALGVGPGGLEWIVDAYVLTYATLLVAGGTLGDRWGRKRMFLLGVALFAGGSLLTGLAPSTGVLILGRALQGIGPALLVPGSLTIIRAMFDDERERATAIGLWSMSSGLAMALGPVLGGLLVDAAGWRWVFLFNVPLAVLLLVVAVRVVPGTTGGSVRAGFDWGGTVFSALGIALLVFAVIEGQSAGWSDIVVVLCFVLGVAAMVGFVRWERRSAEPLIDVRLFLNKGFVVANVGAFVVFFAFIGIIVYLSAFFQSVQGRSPVATGLIIAILGVSLGVSSAVAGRISDRVGERALTIAGLVVAGAATLALLTVGPDVGVGGLWWQFTLIGAGIGLCGTATTTVAMSAVDADRAGMASAVVNALRQVGQVFGVAVLGALVYGSNVFVDGLHGALWTSGLALLAVAVLAAVLLRRRSAAN